MGFGGGGIIYPARRMILAKGMLQPDGLCYALKECYPASDGQEFIRTETGEIAGRDPVCQESLESARQRYATEKDRNQAIHVTASRMLPILESTHQISLALPGQEARPVENAVSVMESLENKGRSLSDCLAERRRFQALETCRILQQLLFALREVHRAGYLHLDLQGGNVFLRGALEDQSDMLTLIDFGSARAVEEDGKTEAIHNREIFTSRGFSAPEMLLHNDGQLRLGVEADLYSVGCIGLYLLTGQRPNPSQLLANRTGNYLKPNQMRLVNCPAHLQERLQQLLAGALAKEPENRYHCADEMLEQVNSLLEALQPARTVLGSVKYDAFICYKHGPVDSAVARKLQQRLENFRTTDNSGRRIRPFRRVFMDEGELSACADFGQLIRDALENSLWLVVICSEDTLLSPWVKLEIETFLSIHGQEARSRILTVLTSGEPETSIPPVLFDAAGKAPFAADVRGQDLQEILKHLKGDAFLRLAAAMLAKPFDSLKQRQKVYQLQRIAAVTAVCLLAAVAFAAYAVNRSRVIAAQALKIEEEYRNTLINESLLLASQAEKQLKSNNPLDAMALARKALPSAQQNRPVVPEAEYVLGKSLGIYKAPGAAEDTVTAVGMIDTDDNRFFLEDSGNYLFLWQSYEPGIRLWDAETLTLVRELLPRESIYYTSRELLIPEKQALIVKGLNRIFCLDYLTGAELWSEEKEDVLALCTSEDHSRVVLLMEPEGEENILCLEILDSETGKSLKKISFRMEEHHEAEMAVVVSEDLRWAAIPAANQENPSVMTQWHALYLVDLEEGTSRRMLDTQTEIVTMKFLEGRLALIRGSGYTLTTRHSNVSYQYTTPIQVEMETYDPATGRRYWSSSQQYYLRDDSIDTLNLVPYDTDTESGTGLLATCGNLCVLLDWQTGRVVRRYELQSEALDVRCRDNGFDTLNADGSCSSAGYRIDTVLNVQYFEDSVSAVCQQDGIYYIQSTPVFSRDYSIRKYALGKSDESYEPLFEAYLRDCGFYDYRVSAEGVRLVLARDNQITFQDSADGSTQTWEMPEGSGFSPYRVEGLSEDARQIYWLGDVWGLEDCWILDTPLYQTDLITGKSKQLEVPAQPEPYMAVMDSIFFEESFYFTALVSYDGGSDLAVYRWDLTDGTLEECFRRTMEPAADPEDEETGYYWEEYQYNSLYLDKETRQLGFATQINRLETPKRLFRMDLSDGKAAEIAVNFSPEPNPTESIQWKKHCYQWNPEGSLVLFGFGSSLYGVNSRGEEVLRIPAEGYDPFARFLPEGESLLLLTADRVLRQYRLSDGACLASIDLTEHRDNVSVYGDEIQLSWVEEDTVALFTGWDGFLLDHTGETVKIRAVLEQAIGYDSRNDRFFVAESESYSGKPATVGSFPRYTLEDLLEKANEILGS